MGCGGSTSGTHGERTQLKAGGAQGTRGAHAEHSAHVCDARRIEGQRLVERLRALFSRKEGIRCGGRCGPGAGARPGGPD